MARSHPEWALLCNERGYHWYSLAKKSPAKGNVRPKQAIYAIPSKDLVSVPKWVNTRDPEIIEQVISVETEKMGIPNPEGPGRLRDWKPVQSNDSQSLIHIVCMPWSPDSVSRSDTRFDFVPQFALYQPPPGGAVLWKEGDEWIAGFSRDARWLHVQSMGTDEELQFLPTEFSLTLCELRARQLLGPVDRIVTWDDMELTARKKLEDQTGLRVETVPPPFPAPPRKERWSLQPHEVAGDIIRKARNRRVSLFVFLGIVLLLAVAALGYVQLRAIENGNQMLADRIASNQQLADVVEGTMDRWHALEPSIDPNRSTVELFFRVSSLLPPKGFRLTHFEVLEFRTIVIRGEASSMSHALKMKGLLEGAELLRDYNWEIPPPIQKNKLTEFTATGTYLFDNLQ